MKMTQSYNILVVLYFSHFCCLPDIHLMTRHNLIEIVMVTCIDAESIYLCV